jgi:carboxypeptidase PM20D1
MLMKKILLTAAILLLLLISLLIINTLTYKSKQQFLNQGKIDVSKEAKINLSDAIKIKTISYDNSNQFDSTEFQKIIPFFKTHFPLTDSLLEKELINNFSILYKWQGKNLNLKPIILLAHTDVVPAEGKWTEDPFSGLIKNGYIWGRGSLDDKVGVLGIMEATEKLLKENFTPERTVYLRWGKKVPRQLLLY